MAAGTGPNPMICPVSIKRGQRADRNRSKKACGTSRIERHFERPNRIGQCIRAKEENEVHRQKRRDANQLSRSVMVRRRLLWRNHGAPAYPTYLDSPPPIT